LQRGAKGIVLSPTLISIRNLVLSLTLHICRHLYDTSSTFFLN
jgi:hypothetical protein